MNSLLILLALSTTNLKPIDVAYLVLEKDAATIVEPLRGALASSDALTRTTAARVAGVRDERALVPDLRKAAEHEADATAAREELRSIALLGAPDDVDYAIESSRKWPVSVTASVEWMIAGRPDGIDLYFSKLRGHSHVSSEFFTRALWGRTDLRATTESRLAALSDAAAWRSLLNALRESHLALQPEAGVAVLNGASEEMRTETVWYYLRSFAKNPDDVPRTVRDAFSDPQQTASDREAFGRELVRRMFGAGKKEDPRWLAWLETKEADDLLAYNDPDVFALLTDREFALRKNHCGILPVECTMPKERPTKLVGRVVSPRPVRQPEIALPAELPAGLAGAIASGCSDAWFGLASVSTDGAGRVQDVDLSHVGTKCSREIETILRLSYATNLSVASPHTSSDILLSRAPRTTPCLDEDAPGSEPSVGLTRTGGKVVAPKARRRVDPVYPGEWHGSQSAAGNVFVIIQAIISKTGCVRSVRLIAQSPFPEFNSSAVYAVSQWTFYPGMLDGKPVDVIYNVTVNFKQ
ncbi:MAG TPA: energy transducer TonB [Thermoanaerobaculia bacterium]